MTGILAIVLILTTGACAQWLESTLPVGNEPVALCFNPQDCKVYVACEEGTVVTVIDGATNRILRNLAVGGRPKALCYNSANNCVYVACYGSYEVWVIDGAADSVVTTISLPIYFSISDVCYNPASDKIYGVTSSNSGVIIDAATNRYVRAISLPSGLHKVFHNPVNNHIYFSSNSTHSLRVVDGSTDEVLGDVPSGNQPYAFCYDSADCRIFCADRLGTAWVYDAASDSVIGSIYIGASVWDICYNPNRGVVYCANSDGDELVLVDAASGIVIGRVPAGDGPIVVKYAAIDDKVYCVNWFGFTVTVLDGTTDSLLATIPVGPEPNALTWNPDWHRMYVSNLRNATVSVICDRVTGMSTSPSQIDWPSPASTVANAAICWEGEGAAWLFDGCGRRIMQLRRGRNSIASLPTGIYYVQDLRSRRTRITVLR